MVTFYGSDFYKPAKWQHNLNRKSLRLIDGLFCINEVMLADLVRKYEINTARIEVGILTFLMNTFISFESSLSLRQKKKRTGYGV